MNIAECIERYLDGPATLRRAVEGLSADELDDSRHAALTKLATH